MTLPSPITYAGDLYVSNQSDYTLAVTFTDEAGDPIDVTAKTITFETSGGFTKDLVAGATSNSKNLELLAGDLAASLGVFDSFVIRDENNEIHYEGRVIVRGWLEAAPLTPSRQYFSNDPVVSSTLTLISSDMNTEWTLTGAGVNEYEKDDANILYPNGTYAAGTGFPNENFMFFNSMDSSTDDGVSPVMEFVMNGDSFEFATRGGVQIENFALMVDGVYTNQQGYPSPASDGNLRYVRVDFESVATRTVRLVGTRNLAFGKLRVNGTLETPPDTSNRKKWWVVGDSISEGFDMMPTDVWWSWVRDTTYIDEIAASALGATGYIYQGGGPNFQNRINDVLQAVDGGPPDGVIVAGGINDNASSDADVEYWANQYLTLLRAGAPNMRIIVLNNFAGSTGWGAAEQSRADAIEAATVGIDDCHYVDCSAIYDDPNWSTYFDPGDLTHPLASGHKRMGEVIAENVRDLTVLPPVVAPTVPQLISGSEASGGFQAGGAVTETAISAYAVPTGSDKILIVKVAGRRGNNIDPYPVTGVTFNGNAMTEVTAARAGDRGANGPSILQWFIYYLGDTTPTGDIDVTTDAYYHFEVDAIVISGAAQTAQPVVAASVGAVDGTSTALTGLTGEHFIVDGVIAAEATDNLAATETVIAERARAANTSTWPAFYTGMQYAVADGDKTMAWTYSGSVDRYHSALAFASP